MARQPTKTASDNEIVLFESREKEPTMFDVDIYRPIRDFSSGRLIWEVPASDAERFSKHHFVQNGRVVRKNG